MSLDDGSADEALPRIAFEDTREQGVSTAQECSATSRPAAERARGRHSARDNEMFLGGNRLESISYRQ